MKKQDFLLNFSTERPERQHIMIDEVSYDMAVPEDFELEEFMELASKGQAAPSLMTDTKGSISPAKTKELREVLDTVVKQAILDLPEEVFVKLRAVQKFAIVHVFSDAVSAKLGRGPAPQDQEQEAAPGAKSSPDSTDSTDQETGEKPISE